MVDLKPYYDYGIIQPGWSPEKIADEMAKYAKFQIDEIFRRGLKPWRNRQDGTIDKILNAIVSRKRTTRTSKPILTVEDLDQFIMEQSEKHKDKWNPEEIKTTGEHKFINTLASNVYELYCIAHPRVTPEPNKADKRADFWVDGVRTGFPFDLKVTPWPTRLNYRSCKRRTELFERCINDPRPLVEWYYKNQGQNSRWGWQNRLFIVCYDAQDFEHKMLKSDFTDMGEVVKSYFDKFDSSKLVRVSQQEVTGEIRLIDGSGRPTQETAYADVIWNYKDYRINPPRHPGGLAPVGGYQATMF